MSNLAVVSRADGARAINTAVAAISSDRVVVVARESELDDKAVRALERALDDPSTALACAIAGSPDGTVIAAGNAFVPSGLGPIGVESVSLGSGLSVATVLAAAPISVPLPARLAVAFRRDLFAALGGFDERYGADAALADFALRARAHGGVAIAPGAVIVETCDAEILPGADADLLGLWEQHGDELVGGSAAFELRFGTVVRRVGATIVPFARVPAPDIVALLGGSEIAVSRAAARIREMPLRIERVLPLATASVDALAPLFAQRGERYVLLADADRFDASALWSALDRLEAGIDACAAPLGEGLLVNLARIPRALPFAGDSVETALRALVAGASAAGRAVRGGRPLRRAQPERRSRSVVVALGSNEQHARVAFELALTTAGVDAEVFAVHDGGSRFVEQLGRFDNVRIVADPSIARGVNRALADARGEVLVAMTDDFAVNSGWLDTFDRALALDGGMGIAGPRTNTGVQGVNDAAYANPDAMRAYAARRAKAWRRRTQRVDHLDEPIVAIDREALGAIGGFDPALGFSGIAFRDLTLRARAAGYTPALCEDVFVHRYAPSDPPARDAVAAFVARYGADANERVRHGFPDDWAVPLVAPAPATRRDGYRLVFLARPTDETSWSHVAPLLRKFIGAFAPADEAAFAIAVGGSLSTALIGQRVRRLVDGLALPPDAVADVVVEAIDDGEISAWIAAYGSAMKRRVHDVPELAAIGDLRETSPSGLRRLLQAEALR